jgi:hypothetical protein
MHNAAVTILLFIENILIFIIARNVSCGILLVNLLQVKKNFIEASVLTLMHVRHELNAREGEAYG